MSYQPSLRKDASYQSLWKKISSEVYRHFELVQLGPVGVGIDQRQEFERLCEIEVLALLVDLAERSRRAAEPARVFAVRALREACQVLGLKSPKRGQPVDERKARRAKTLLVKQYHPDLRGGDESANMQLSATLEAFRRVVDYNRMLKEKSHG